jgi:hypothetical protein
MANTRKKRIKRGDLLPWFLEDHARLPQWYLDDCQKFFLELDRRQADKHKKKH